MLHSQSILAESPPGSSKTIFQLLINLTQRITKINQIYVYMLNEPKCIEQEMLPSVD